MFGRVIDGMEYVDTVERGEPPANPSTILHAYIAADNPPAYTPRRRRRRRARRPRRADAGAGGQAGRAEARAGRTQGRVREELSAAQTGDGRP